MSSATVILPLERKQDFRDADGVLSFTKRLDEIKQLVLDWSTQLATGETVSSVAYEDRGVTTSNKSATTTTSTCDVTGVGEVQVTATLSTGRKLQLLVRYYEADGGRRIHDYGC